MSAAQVCDIMTMSEYIPLAITPNARVNTHKQDVFLLISRPVDVQSHSSLFTESTLFGYTGS